MLLKQVAHRFAAGRKVRVIATAFTTPRRSRIAGHYINRAGLPMYWLADGGLLSETELEDDQTFKTKGA